MIVILKACRKEIDAFPEEIRGDLADALARLDTGLVLSMPLSRPMHGIGRGAHELGSRTGLGRIGSCMPSFNGVPSTFCMPSRRQRKRHLLATWNWHESG